MWSGSTIIQMTDGEFRLLQELLLDHFGLSFGLNQKYLFEHRLSSRLGALQLISYSDYYRYLKYNPDGKQELEELADRLTNNETYFFREVRQLQVFKEEIVPLLMEKNKEEKTIRIWSAGCSSGEEPYTIAIMLKEIPELSNWRIEIFGNDISRRVLQKAREGVYGSSSFRAIPPQYLEKYFRRMDNSHYELAPQIKSMVNFGHLNLLDSKAAAFIMPTDVIFCRNVLIYFDQPTRDNVISLYYRKLRRGGFLLLGHSENLINISTEFELVSLSADIVYRRPLVGDNGSR